MFSSEENLPITKFPDQKSDAKHKNIAAFKDVLTRNKF